jgi:hypothetical protein
VRAERPAGRSSQSDTLSLFTVMWALAAVWHLLGNPSGAPAWAQALLVAGVGAVLLRPGDPLALGLLALGGLLTMWEDAGFVNLSILGAVVTGIVRRRPSDPTDLANRLLPPARLCLLGFYAFAAFSKLNEDFFDRSVSCATFYFHESTDSLGLTRLQLGGAAWLETAVIVGTAAVELVIPILLIVSRTRRAGVVLALVFHSVLALDRSHEFFDFSSLLFALFVLFLPPDAGSWVAERLGSVRARLALRHEALPERVHLVLGAVPVTVGVLVVLDALRVDVARDVGWLPFQVYAAVAIAATVTFLRQRRAPARVRLRPHHVLFAVAPLLVVANGLTPYLELKTGYGWNMYANLRTVDGESNHFIVRRTLPLTDEQADVVEIIHSSAPALASYARNDYGLTWRQLRIFLSRHPDVSITYRRGARVVGLHRAADDPDLVAPVPGWREKVQLFRAVDLEEPERCVPLWGPAR